MLLHAALFCYSSYFFSILDIDNKILRFLTEAGDDGLSVQKISRHVFNECNTFFENILFEDVHRYVQSFLLRNSKNPDSMIEKTGERGYYRLNPDNKESRQLILLFRDDTPEETSKPQEDLSLSLF